MRQVIANPENTICISTTSFWELAIKMRLGKLKLSKPLGYIIQELPKIGITILSPVLEAPIALSTLPFHHRDPFDRMLICQAQVEGLILISQDEVFGEYDVEVLW